MLKNRSTDAGSELPGVQEDEPDVGQERDGLVVFDAGGDEPGPNVARQSRVYHSSSEEEEEQSYAKTKNKAKVRNSGRIFKMVKSFYNTISYFVPSHKLTLG